MNNKNSNNNMKETENVQVSNNSESRSGVKSVRGFALEDELRMRRMREEMGISPDFDRFVEMLGTLRNGLERKSQEYYYKYGETATNIEGIDEIDDLVHTGSEALTTAITRLAGINIAAKTMYNCPC